MEQKHIQRINELARLARERALTADEQAERQTLRQNYLKAFRAQMRGQLDSTVVEYPDGSRVPLKDINKHAQEEKRNG